MPHRALPPIVRLIVVVSVLAASAGIAQADGMATTTTNSGATRGPVGWQTYRRLDLLPLLREGVTTYQASSADSTNHNDDGFSGRYSCLHRVPLGCLMAEHTGPGELESVWTAGNQQAQPGPEGHLIIRLDGRTVIDDDWPALTAGRPASPFAFPFALPPTVSWGGSSIQVPMTFRHSMQVISQHNPHYFHVVYRTFSSGVGLRHGPRNRNPGDVLAELRHAGTRDPKPAMGPRAVSSRSFSLTPGSSILLAHLRGSGAITQLRLDLSRYHSTGVTGLATQAADVYEHARLLISFDGQTTVDAPLGEFFGSGLGPARVRSLMFAMQSDPTGPLITWWPMPFARDATVTLVNDSRTTISAGRAQTIWARDAQWRTRLAPGGDFGYFHAYSHSGDPARGHYWTFLRSRGRGTFVGVTLTIAGANRPIYLEGNERAYVDGAIRPQIQGTGTEDFFDGGWYFFNNLFTLPLTGASMQSTSASGCPVATCKTMYRVMLADSVAYSHSILYEIQHGSQNLVAAHYSSTAYYYEQRAR